MNWRIAAAMSEIDKLAPDLRWTQILTVINAALGDKVLYSTNEPHAEEIWNLIDIGMLEQVWPEVDE